MAAKVMDDATRLSRNETLRDLLVKLDLHAPGERAHGERVAVYSVAIGEALGLTDEVLLNLRYAATLHDIGKIRLDRDLLMKLGRITDEELSELRRHAALAEETVASVDWLLPAMPLIRHHHEWWNGQGYPDGLAGATIPLGARIIGLSEAFDVLATNPGEPEAVESAALDEVQACAGTQFDPKLVATFMNVQKLIQPLTA